MSINQCISYRENQLIGFNNSLNRSTINVLPIRQDPYVFIREGNVYNDKYFLKKYEFQSPDKPMEICGPLVMLIIELASKLRFK